MLRRDLRGFRGQEVRYDDGRLVWNMVSESPCASIHYEESDSSSQGRLNASSVPLREGGHLLRITPLERPLEGFHSLFLVVRGGRVESHGLLWNGGDVVGGSEWRVLRGTVRVGPIKSEALTVIVDVPWLRGGARVDLGRSSAGLARTLEGFAGAPDVAEPR